MSTFPLSVGIIGCGTISGAYLTTCAALPNLNVVACADIDLARAQARAQEHGVPVACSVDELLANPAIELVINLTVPHAHAAVSRAALEAGKHVYVEKPLAVRREDGAALLALAAERGLAIGAAPDTFMGAGLQTARALLDAGAIGRPVAGTALMLGSGPERWHPDPAFFYKEGAGPLFDVGPYYLTALVTLLGPIARVTGVTRITYPERLITSQPHAGSRVTVEVPTHVAGVLEFISGVVVNMIVSFDIQATRLPPLELFGTAGSMALPDPNTFGGPVLVCKGPRQPWEEQPLLTGFTPNNRGIGAADLAAAVQEGRAARAGGALAFHVLDVMHTLYESAQMGRHLEVASRCDVPAPVTPDPM